MTHIFVGMWLYGCTRNDQSGGGGGLSPLERQAGAFPGSGYEACRWK